MRYNPTKIEKKWQSKWLRERIYEPDLKKAKKPFYNLTMFPYPSAEGLHVGNMYDVVGCDIYGRYKRMQGHDVFQPMGLDGFGIHSENYALKINKHPADLSKITQKRFYEQILSVGAGFAWNERLETYDPEYYKWTQWIFVQMFKRGLAYRKKALVNWCPSCKTVLADEQVAAGECERCGTKAVKKELEQWFFKITDYAERLLKNLEKIDWSERVKIAQRNWIGKSEGALIKFQVVIANEVKQSHEIAAPRRGIRARNDGFIEVFTTRPDTLFGATYMVLSPEHELITKMGNRISNSKEVEGYIKKAKTKTEEERTAERKEKTGIEAKGIKAVNPANGEEIPVWVSDYVLGNIGTGAIMAVPAHDQRDFEFAKKINLPIKIVVCPHYPETTCPILDNAYEEEGRLVASGRFDGMASQEAREAIIKFVKGKKKIQYRLRDWLISRQRYWGPPIPMIFCEKCARLRQGYGGQGWQTVPEKDLPVTLPYIKNFRPTGTEKSPLALVEKFYKVRCPKCNSWARRETDVSDTFLDSAWYYYRYLDKENKKEIFSRNISKKWLPVDRYMGGFEHAVLHLLYTRFIAMVFNDWGLVSFDEPFRVFRAHGHITKDGAKMSKSRGNVINPDEYIRAYGADALRMYLMFLGPFEQGGDFQDTGIKGITRFLERVWKLTRNVIPSASSEHALRAKPEGSPEIPRFSRNDELKRLLHKTIKKVTEDIDNLHYNTAISALMILLNEFEKNPEAVSREDIKIFLKILAPFAPFITEELWHEHCERGSDFASVHKEKWPQYNQKYIKEETFELVIQVNGKVRDKIEADFDISENDAKKMALQSDRIKKILSKDVPKKIIYVPNRLVNIVV